MNKPAMTFSHIVAASRNQVIGLKNQLPWHIPDDLKFFNETTRRKALIMGRKTFESLGKPLPGRLNVVVTRNKDFQSKSNLKTYIPLWTGGIDQLFKSGAYPENATLVTEKSLSVVVCPSIKDAMDFCSRKEVLEKYGREIFIIGGGEIYKQTLPFVNRIYLTRIHKDYEGDAFYPEIPLKEFQEVSRKETPEPVPHSFLVYERPGSSKTLDHTDCV
ncbi:MAG: dihydrofolate reductase [Bdellovibrionales bacterium]|nr:dihydrofolate reductase [Bdellovibrionales bacterium]